ncbi:type VI secretion system lipoprotein TssJ [Desulfoluna spongiiphila]|uniref:Type VI secretion lipoprotein, VC_A0113 family n=1 Tax=Desulfoluna spongiiphila TaxID=419481 RepID=A0A1G5E087_9BACT|nr:type VI secretion system lipoprotein TssJ [Desulfoluna spongiiphila]SCY20473.1 type VI secretion lipoprotein, VC_A0113 family [Desulfoluna spongiiphila]VVS91525.1 type vi secretion system lipoprotein scin [Desulfoluna spongiiphila]
MKKTIFVVLFLCVSSVCGCGFAPVSPPEWKLEKEGIVLHFEADNQLNQRHGKAYTLYVVLYQLNDPNSFNQLCLDEDGLAKLLECKVYDESVTSVKSIYIYPGSDVTHRMERAEGTRYLGIVAGYGMLTQERMVRLLEIPVYIERESSFSFNKKLVPGLLEADFKLGPDQIVDVDAEEN